MPSAEAARPLRIAQLFRGYGCGRLEVMAQAQSVPDLMRDHIAQQLAISSSGTGSFCALASSGLTCVKYQVSSSFKTSSQMIVCEETTSPLRGSIVEAPSAFCRRCASSGSR
jgi:hypothetical protein